MAVPFSQRLYTQEPAGTFIDGHVFVIAPDLTSAQQDAGAGYWRCDIADQDRLTWSDKVYELFGLRSGAPVDRSWAVDRYSQHSRNALENVRTYALSRKLGFILDAAIKPADVNDRWIRVLACPILAKGRVVGLHGLKRSISYL